MTMDIANIAKKISLKKEIAHKISHVEKALRSVTAAVLMSVAILAPTNVVEYFSGPTFSETMATVLSEDNDDSLTAKLLQGDLTNEERNKLFALALLSQATLAEPKVTDDMKELEKITDARLVGLDHRLKTFDSLSRKLTKVVIDDKVPVFLAAQKIHDVLRYTLTLDADNYSENIPSALSFLTNKGYVVTKFNNAWGGKYYQGINVQLLSPQGTTFELQFHTPQSFAIKQASHAVYEIRRNPASTPEQIAEAKQRSLDYNAQVIAPAGAHDITWRVAA